MKKDQKKTTIIVIVSLAVIVLALSYFFIGKSDKGPAVIKESNTQGLTTEDSVLAADVLMRISQIDSLKMEDSIVDNATFVKLKDISVPVSNEQIGKQNPFSR